jgi:DNA-directed RNA polymerase subunit K/omega
MKSGENYLDLIETHKQDKKINLFEKVIVMTKRAKSLYSLEASALAGLKHKPTYQAILESNKGRLIMKRVETENLEKEKL